MTWPFSKKPKPQPSDFDAVLELIGLACEKLEAFRCDTSYQPAPEDFDKLNRISYGFHRGVAPAARLITDFAARVENGEQ